MLSLLELSLTGGVFILAVVVVRALAMNRLPRQAFLLLWAVALARREAAKIEKHRDIWQENAKREQEHLEDLELEEFATPSRASDDA